MRKSLVALVVVMLASLSMVGTASAQDQVVGTVTADPPAVTEAGEVTFAVTGEGFIPDSSGVLVTTCVVPGDPFEFGVTSEEEISERITAMVADFLGNCDVATAVPVEPDGDGNWATELTADVGDNFVILAGALDQSQGGLTYVPLASAEALAAAAGGGEEEAETTEEEDLPETGVETPLLGIIGVAVLGAGVMVAREGRRLR